MSFEKRKQSKKGLFKTALITCSVSIALFPVVTLIFGIICYNGTDPLGKSGIFALISLAVCGAVGGIFAWLYAKELGAAFAAICCILCATIFFCLGLIFTDSTLPSRIMNALCYIAPYLTFSNILRFKRKKQRTFTPSKRH